MKKLLMILAVASTLLTLEPARACSITPQGDSRLRVISLHDSLGQMEVMTGFKALTGEQYEVAIHSYETGKEELRLYKLENTSPMCPVYKVTRLK